MTYYISSVLRGRSLKAVAAYVSGNPARTGEVEKALKRLGISSTRPISIDQLKKLAELFPLEAVQLWENDITLPDVDRTAVKSDTTALGEAKFLAARAGAFIASEARALAELRAKLRPLGAISKAEVLAAVPEIADQLDAFFTSPTPGLLSPKGNFRKLAEALPSATRDKLIAVTQKALTELSRKASADGALLADAISPAAISRTLGGIVQVTGKAELAALQNTRGEAVALIAAAEKLEDSLNPDLYEEQVVQFEQQLRLAVVVRRLMGTLFPWETVVSDPGVAGWMAKRPARISFRELALQEGTTAAVGAFVESGALRRIKVFANLSPGESSLGFTNQEITDLLTEVFINPDKPVLLFKAGYAMAESKASPALRQLLTSLIERKMESMPPALLEQKIAQLQTSNPDAGEKEAKQELQRDLAIRVVETFFLPEVTAKAGTVRLNFSGTTLPQELTIAGPADLLRGLSLAYSEVAATIADGAVVELLDAREADLSRLKFAGTAALAGPNLADATLIGTDLGKVKLATAHPSVLKGDLSYLASDQTAALLAKIRADFPALAKATSLAEVLESPVLATKAWQTTLAELANQLRDGQITRLENLRTAQEEADKAKAKVAGLKRTLITDPLEKAVAELEGRLQEARAAFSQATILESLITILRTDQEVRTAQVAPLQTQLEAAGIEAEKTSGLEAGLSALRESSPSGDLPARTQAAQAEVKRLEGELATLTSRNASVSSALQLQTRLADAEAALAEATATPEPAGVTSSPPGMDLVDWNAIARLKGMGKVSAAQRTVDEIRIQLTAAKDENPTVLTALELSSQLQAAVFALQVLNTEARTEQNKPANITKLESQLANAQAKASEASGLETRIQGSTSTLEARGQSISTHERALEGVRTIAARRAEIVSQLRNAEVALLENQLSKAKAESHVQKALKSDLELAQAKAETARLRTETTETPKKRHALAAADRKVGDLENQRAVFPNPFVGFGHQEMARAKAEAYQVSLKASGLGSELETAQKANEKAQSALAAANTAWSRDSSLKALMAKGTLAPTVEMLAMSGPAMAEALGREFEKNSESLPKEEREALVWLIRLSLIPDLARSAGEDPTHKIWANRLILEALYPGNISKSHDLAAKRGQPVFANALYGNTTVFPAGFDPAASGMTKIG